MNEDTKQANLSALCTIVNGFRSEGKYCDVNIQVGDRSFQSHRLLLAALSDYFDRMFGGSFRERNVDQNEPIVLHDIDEVAFEAILEFMYTGDVNVTDSNVCSLLRTSDFLRLRISFIEDRCVQHIESSVQKNEPLPNALELFLLACVAKKSVLIDLLSRHICKHLNHFQQDSKFLTISYDELNLILEQKQGFRGGENTVLNTVTRWIHHSREERKKYRDELMKRVDFSKISSDCMTFMLDEYEKLIDRVTLKENVGIEDTKEDDSTFLGTYPGSVNDESKLWLFVKSSPKNIKLFSATNDLSSSPFSCAYEFFRDVEKMRSVALGDVMYSLSYNRNGIQSFRVSHSIDDIFDGDSLKNPPSLLKRFKMCGTHNNIYACESCVGHPLIGNQRLIGEIYAYNCEINKWCSLPSMPEKVFNCCMTICDNVLYTFGGFHLYNNYATCAQAYDFRTKLWQKFPSNITKPFSNGDCCTHKGKIYFGEDMNQFEMEIFDPVAGKWGDAGWWGGNIGMRLVSYKNELWKVDVGLKFEIYNDTVAEKWRRLPSVEGTFAKTDLLEDIIVF